MPLDETSFPWPLASQNDVSTSVQARQCKLTAEIIDLLKTHNAHVRKVVPKDRLLEMEISDGWEPLCKFLGKPIPDEPFPRSNDAAATEQRFKEAVLNALLIWLGIISFTIMGIYVIWSIWAISQQSQPVIEIMS